MKVSFWAAVVVAGIILVSIAGIVFEGKPFPSRQRSGPAGVHEGLEGRDAQEMENRNVEIKNSFGRKGRIGSLPSCGDKQELFSVLPVRLEDLNSLLPLGLMVPPDHTFPAPHNYAMVVDWRNPVDKEANVFAPSDLAVAEIGIRRYKEWEGLKDYLVYSLISYPCREFAVYFHNLKSLTFPALAQQAEGILEECDFKESAVGGWCAGAVDIKIPAGEIIGTTGDAEGKIYGVDIGARDYRLSSGRDFARPERFCMDNGDGQGEENPYGRCYTACLFDYYPEEIRSKLKFFEKEQGVARTVAPLCGSVYYDIPGTLQGSWFPMGTAVDPNALEAEVLHLGPEYLDPTLSVFSVGTSVAKSGLDARLYYFTPTHDGRVNGDFREAAADGTVYCYELMDSRTGQGGNAAAVIVQLNDDVSLTIERLKANSCGNGPWSFSERKSEFER